MTATKPVIDMPPPVEPPPVVNGADLTAHDIQSIFISGDIGTGKSLQARTFSGRKLVYAFEHSALKIYAGDESFDVAAFLPKGELGYMVKKIPKGGIQGATFKADRKSTFADWEDHFSRACDSDMFEKYDWIIFDGTTSFQDIMLADVILREGRPMYQPLRDDYGTMAFQLVRVMDTLFRICHVYGCKLYVIGHRMMRKDEESGKIYNQALLVGQQETKTPARFGAAILAERPSLTEKQAQELPQDFKPKFYVRTIPDNKNVGMKSAPFLGDLHRIDVTLDFSKPLVGQGLGKYVNK